MLPFQITCLAHSVLELLLINTLATNTGPVVTFTSAGGAAAGEIYLSVSTIFMNIAGQSTRFNVTVRGHQFFQLCSDGSTLTLYQSCASPQTQPFGPTSLTGVMESTEVQTLGTI